VDAVAVEVAAGTVVVLGTLRVFAARGHLVLHLVGKGAKPATMPLTVPVFPVLEACLGSAHAVRRDRRQRFSASLPDHRP
jgi:hypothetical protein